MLVEMREGRLSTPFLGRGDNFSKSYDYSNDENIKYLPYIIVWLGH